MRHFICVRGESRCFFHTAPITLLVHFGLRLWLDYGWFLPLAFSRRLLWPWTSTVPALHTPGICSQLESGRPQTSVHSSDTPSAEPHNPGPRTSPRACWCRCLAPSSAGEPVGPPWMSSSPDECNDTTRTEIAVSDATQTRCFPVPTWLIQVDEDNWEGPGQVEWIDGGDLKQMCNTMTATAHEIQTRIRLEQLNTHCFIFCACVKRQLYYNFYLLLLYYNHADKNRHTNL